MHNIGQYLWILSKSRVSEIELVFQNNMNILRLLAFIVKLLSKQILPIYTLEPESAHFTGNAITQHYHSPIPRKC